MGSALALSSCNDWLDLTPENSVTANDYWASESDVASAMTGIYSSWQNAANRMFMHGEMRADNITFSGYVLSSSVLAYQDVREFNITSTNTWVGWQPYYSCINNCNLLIANADKALGQDPSFSAQNCRIYKAQARVVRAFMYFYLIRVYKDVPYVTWPYSDDTIERDVAPTSQIAVLNSIINDVEAVQAEGDLPYSYNQIDNKYNKGQVTMYFLKALLADMYRWKGALETNMAVSQESYSKCKTLCDEIISSGQFALLKTYPVPAENYGSTVLEEASTAADSAFYVQESNVIVYGDMFKEIYVEGNSGESIFELQSDNYTSNPFFDMLISPRREYAPNAAHLEDDIFPATRNDIARSAGWKDIRLGMNVRGNGINVYCWKYAGTDADVSETIASAEENKKNILVYRLAEIYLMKAEALVQMAWASGQDQELLLEAYRAAFKVRDRACAVESTDCEDFPVQQTFWKQLRNDEPIELGRNSFSCRNMEKFILEEENREMLFEGRRWFDVLRHAERNSQGTGSCTGGSLNYLLNMVVAATTTNKVAFLSRAYMKPESHYLPYPAQDVRTNALLKQKPFYGTE